MKWTNWAGNQVARPETIEDPADEVAVAALVAGAHASGRAVRVAASGHSFTAAAVTDDLMVRIGGLQGIRSIDRAAMTVTVGAGTPLWRLNELLHAEGLALPNLGDIAYQTVAGAISTSTHGTGARIGGLATQVKGMRIVDGAGNVVVCDRTTNADVLDVARVGEEIHITASALSFLHRQVRSMVGSLEHVGSGRWSAGDLRAALEARDRARCGVVAPAQGLYLAGVDYPSK